MIIAPLACLLAVASLVAAERSQHRPSAAAAKIAASTAFVWAALEWGALESTFGKLVLGGLVLCWLGDALLIPRGQGRAFQAGIAAFLLGHLCYAAASLVFGIDPLAAFAAAAAMALVAGRTLAWLGPNVPEDFRLPVHCYVIVIAAMVVATCGAAAAGAPLLLALGAIGFAASDLSVARERFVKSEFVNGAWGLPAYFVSQLAIGYSVALASGT